MPRHHQAPNDESNPPLSASAQETTHCASKSEGALPVVPDVLASRYASPPLQEIWSPRGKIQLERRFWLEVMRVQQDLGVAIPAEAIEAYERHLDNIDLADIDRRERVLRHDVKARLEAYNALAGCQYAHRGMTSRDLTDNVEQVQQLQSMQYLGGKTLSLLHRLASLCVQHEGQKIAARTHHVPAAPTTLGRRLAMWGEPLLRAWQRLSDLCQNYPLRGIRGAIGIRADTIALLGSVEKAELLDARLAQHFGFSQLLENPGQVYPRSLDDEVLSAYYAIAAALNNMATSFRLMAGAEMLNEGFAKSQTGSSAMPHKMNARSCERVHGFHVLLGGYLAMAHRLAGAQWNEGDVSCSVVRRVMLPQATFSLDGALETMLTVLIEMEFYPAVIDAELHRFLPFLASSRLLMEAVQRGEPREEMHRCIKTHAVAASRAVRRGAKSGTDFVGLLGEDPAFPLSTAEIRNLLAHSDDLLGAADVQTKRFVTAVERQCELHPQWVGYQPHAIR